MSSLYNLKPSLLYPYKGNLYRSQYPTLYIAGYIRIIPMTTQVALSELVEFQWQFSDFYF